MHKNVKVGEHEWTLASIQTFQMHAALDTYVT